MSTNNITEIFFIPVEFDNIFRHIDDFTEIFQFVRNFEIVQSLSV